MTMRAVTICLLVSAQVSLSSLAQAGDLSGTAAPYLRQGIHARYVAMGQAGTATVDDSSAVYWNPAVISRLKEPGVTAQTALLGNDQSWQYLGLIYPIQSANGSKYGFGFGWLSYSAGKDLEYRTANRLEPTYLFDDHQSTIMVSLASDIGAAFHLGVNAKFLMHHLDDDDANGFGLDLGFWQSVNDQIAWGVMVQDLFSSIKWPSEHQDKLPLLIRPGVRWQGLNQTLILAVEGTLALDNRNEQLGPLAYHLGAEYRLVPAMAVRLGLNDNQLTTGLGWRFQLNPMLILGLDYAFAWEKVETAGHRHLFSLEMKFKNNWVEVRD